MNQNRKSTRSRQGVQWREGAGHATFAETMAATRADAAEVAWKQARLAARLRRAALAQGRKVAAKILQKVKDAAFVWAVHLAPQILRDGMDWTRQGGLLTTRRQDCERGRPPTNTRGDHLPIRRTWGSGRRGRHFVPVAARTIKAVITSKGG